MITGREGTFSPNSLVLGTGIVLHTDTSEEKSKDQKYALVIGSAVRYSRISYS